MTTTTMTTTMTMLDDVRAAHDDACATRDDARDDVRRKSPRTVVSYETRERATERRTRTNPHLCALAAGVPPPTVDAEGSGEGAGAARGGFSSDAVGCARAAAGVPPPIADAASGASGEGADAAPGARAIGAIGRAALAAGAVMPIVRGGGASGGMPIAHSAKPNAPSESTPSSKIPYTSSRSAASVRSLPVARPSCMNSSSALSIAATHSAALPPSYGSVVGQSASAVRTRRPPYSHAHRPHTQRPTPTAARALHARHARTTTTTHARNTHATYALGGK